VCSCEIFAAFVTSGVNFTQTQRFEFPYGVVSASSRSGRGCHRARANQDAMGQQRGDISIAAMSTTRWSVAMTKRKTETVNDLSRCLDPFDMEGTLIAVIDEAAS
jgi:hypothetical protein